MNRRPLPFAERFLSILVKTEYMEEIMGDLLEYEEELLQYPKWKRGVLYWFHVINFLQPWALKRFSGTQKLNNYGMFQNYLKTSLRSLKKNALFSFINIIGLAISMSIGILMILMITEIKSFDNFQENKDRLYRVTSNKFLFGQDFHFTTASYFIGSEIEKNVPGVEASTILRPGLSADLRTDAGLINISGLYATPSFFDVFSFPLIQGNAKTALDQPNSLIITESIAQKLFGGTNVLGKTLEIQSNENRQQRKIDGVITGIIQNPPVNSHLQFEALVSHSTYDTPASGSGWSSDYKTNPDDYQNSYVYLSLEKGVEKEAVEASLPPLVAAYNANEETPLTHLLQPASTFLTSDLYRNNNGPRFSEQQLYIMLGLTLVVIFSAAFNYTNLSLARALRRSKEVGMRKVAGATKSQVFSQFLVEATMLSCFAMVAGLVMFYLLKPAFLNLPDATANGYPVFTLDFTPISMICILLFSIAVGILAGVLPALFLSKLKISQILKGASNVKVFSGVNLRRGLTVLQFTLSIGLIMSAVLMNKQYRFALNYDTGFDTENIVNIRMRGDYFDLLENDLNSLPEVTGTARYTMVMGTGGASLVFMENEGQKDRTMVMVNNIDHNYLDLMNHVLVEGNGFLGPLNEGDVNNKLVVNEHLVKTMKLGTPEEAIGKTIYAREQPYQIVGVVADFLNVSLNIAGNEILNNKSFAFRQLASESPSANLAVKYKTDDLTSLMQKLERSYRKFAPEQPFDARFYEDEIATTYQSQKTTFTIISFLAFLAISIAMLGLLGMAVFTTESRIKEISIRKVLGASVNSLIALLSKGFLIMIVIAAVIAIPVSQYIVKNELLSEFIDKVDFNLFDLSSGFLAVLLIGFFMVGWQIRIATLKNPAETLRAE